MFSHKLWNVYCTLFNLSDDKLQRHDIRYRTQRDDTARVKLQQPVSNHQKKHKRSNTVTYECHSTKIPRLDMLKVACILKRRVVPIQLAQPKVNRGVPVPDRTDVAFEMAVVGWVKADLD